MKKLLICGFWSLLRFIVDSPRIPYVMASQSPPNGTGSSASNTSDEPRRMSGALIGLILIGALAGVAGVGLWALDQLASRTPTPKETAAPVAAPQTPTMPASAPAPAALEAAPAAPEAAPAEPETAPPAPETAPAEPQAPSRT